MEHIYDMIIIGGGPAGYTAALYASRAGLDTLILERMAVGGQMTLTSEIDNYPGYDPGTSGFDLALKMEQNAEHFGAETRYADVVSVDFSRKIKKINLSSESLLAKTVVIATGANPRELGVAREAEMTGRGIHYCAHCDGRFYKDKEVMVIGGGNTAAADALYLSRLVKKVTVVHRRDTLRATKIYHEPLMKAPNVEFIWDSTVKELLIDGKVVGAKLENLKTGKVKDVYCDGIFVSIGRKPATEFLQGVVELDKSGYIVADESTRTSIPGVFAAGDVRTKALRQIVTATADGAVAVQYADEYLAEFAE